MCKGESPQSKVRCAIGDKGKTIVNVKLVFDLRVGNAPLK